MEKGFTRIFWQALCVGLLTGLVIVLFRLGIENMFEFVMVHFYAAPLLFLLITTLGGLAAGFVVYKFAPETSGSGIPYVKISLLKSGRLIRVRTIFVKFIAGVLGIGTGLSLGREGPSVQLGAGAGSFIGKIFKLDEHNRDKLIASGAGAAIGATFNAPIAGTLFVLEELIHRFTPSMLFPTPSLPFHTFSVPSSRVRVRDKPLPDSSFCLPHPGIPPLHFYSLFLPDTSFLFLQNQHIPLLSYKVLQGSL